MIDKQLEIEIREYCKLNEIKYTKFVNDMLRKQFSIEKYGNIPFGTINGSTDVKEEDIEKVKEIKNNSPIEVKVKEEIKKESEPIEKLIETTKSTHKIKIIRK